MVIFKDETLCRHDEGIKQPKDLLIRQAVDFEKFLKISDHARTVEKGIKTIGTAKEATKSGKLSVSRTIKAFKTKGIDLENVESHLGGEQLNIDSYDEV